MVLLNMHALTTLNYYHAWHAALHDQQYQNVIVKLMNAFANGQVQGRDEEPMPYYDQGRYQKCSV